MIAEDVRLAFRIACMKLSFKQDNDCVIPTSIVSDPTTGYMKFSYRGARTYVHRIAYMICKGEVLGHQVVRHTCDNMVCCNPDHLLLGTQADNILDRDLRGRTAIGLQNGKSKLTEDQVRYIRSCVISQRKMMEKFNVSRSTIQNVQNNRTYTDIPWK